MAKDINAEDPPSLSSEGIYGITLAINMKTKQEMDNFFELVVDLGGTIVKT